MHPSVSRLMQCAAEATASLPVQRRITTAVQLRSTLGWSAQRFHNMTRRGLSKDAALEAEAFFSASSSWLLNGPDGPSVWIDRQHRHAGEPAPQYELAHVVSHSTFEAVPLLSREQLMSTKVPDVFRAVVFDDAMAPDYPAGTELVWTTRRRVQPGRLLLIRDAHQHVHIRLCHQAVGPSAWSGVPSNPAFATLHSTDEGIHVLAVLKGRLEPDDA